MSTRPSSGLNVLEVKILLEALTVSGFRKYKRLSLSGLGKINCLLGSNNVGKTTILEAVYVWACGANIQPLKSSPISRGGDASLLFHDRNENMTLDGINDGQRECFTHTLHGELWEVQHNGETIHGEADNFCPAVFIDSINHPVNIELLSDAYVQEINRIFPEITGFTMSSDSINVVRKDGGIIPIYLYGNGLQKCFYVLGSMASCRNAVVCIDEIDTGLHHSVHSGFCASLIHSAMTNNLQIFMTTHSIEFIDSFLEASQGDEGIKIITLREKSGIVTARTLNAREAMNARDNFSMELR